MNNFTFCIKHFCQLLSFKLNFFTLLRQKCILLMTRVKIRCFQIIRGLICVLTENRKYSQKFCLGKLDKLPESKFSLKSFMVQYYNTCKKNLQIFRILSLFLICERFRLTFYNLEVFKMLTEKFATSFKNFNLSRSIIYAAVLL